MLLLKLDMGRLSRHYHNLRVEYDQKYDVINITGDGDSGRPMPVEVNFNVELTGEEEARIVEQATAQALYALLRP